jgi:hypothetical protein
MDVKLLSPGPLQVERLANGRRMLLRDLNLRIGERKLTIPAGFVTDFSSYPRWLPGPAFHRIDVAGVAHDLLFQTGRWGAAKDAPRVNFIEANRVWYWVARAGKKKDSRASWFWAWIGRGGLAAFSWPIWLKYRAADD